MDHEFTTFLLQLLASTDDTTATSRSLQRPNVKAKAQVMIRTPELQVLVVNYAKTREIVRSIPVASRRTAKQEVTSTVVFHPDQVPTNH